MKKESADFSTRWDEVDKIIIRIKESWQQKDIDRLVELYTPLLKRAIKHYRNLNSTDVFDIAREVFVDLIHFFDPSKGVYFGKFIQQAFWWRLTARLKKCQPFIIPKETQGHYKPDVHTKEYYELVRLKCGEVAGDIFLLKIVFGLTKRETSSVMGVPQKTTAMDWQQALDILREIEDI
jgi:predicted DNA-binding protein (UPF0251 family)